MTAPTPPGQPQQPYPAPPPQPYAPPQQPYAQQPYPPQPSAQQPYPGQPYPVGQSYPAAQPVDPNQPHCEVCGAAPAKKIVLQSYIGLIIFYQIRTTRAVLCKQCGTAQARDMMARTLALGWWTIVGPLLVGLGMLVTGLRARSLRKLAEPAGFQRQPLVPGPPPLQRPGPLIVTIVMGGIWLLFLVFIVIAALTPPTVTTS